MLTAGYYHTLRISRISDFGLFLADSDGEEVLLPNRYVSLSNKVGDEITVFVYHDSENRLVATTEKPFATAGELASLKAVDKNAYGFFLDWGLSAKHLFLPNSNQAIPMEIGRSYVVYIYNDNITGRATATARLNKYINNENIVLSVGEQVEILVARRVEKGFRVIVNNKHWGMIYSNQIFRPVKIGDKLTAYVTKITDENRIDISLSQSGLDEIVLSAERIKAALKENNGTLQLSDASSPEEIKEMLQMSKKSFKRAVGHLLKRNIIKIDGNTIKLI